MPGKRWTVARLHSETCYWRSCILLTAARLDLFEFIGTRGKTPAAVAARFGGHAAGWEVFLNALCGMGLLRERRRTYRNSAFAARHLNHRAAVRLWPSYDGLRRWNGLAAALTSGKRPDRQIPFASNRRQAKRLLDSLDVDAREIAPYLLDKVPLKKSDRLLDVGGGLGGYSVAFCQRYPRLEATIVEHPKIVPLARRAIRAAGMTQRIRVVGVDILRQRLPRGFDVALLSNILHAHGDHENRSLLRKLHQSLRPDGRLILRDVFMRRDGTAPEWGTLFSVLLLLHSPRGRCHGIDDILRWVRGAGFSRVKGPFRSSPLPLDPDSVLIAVA
ncbi:MAG TPA: methyltransferase [Candidatus Binatia bacterium]|nr:methyltransferase [Candidatus Binatia bacterium]